MTRVLKALGALLSYPDAALVAAMPEIREAIAAARDLPRADRERLERLAAWLAARDLLDSQEAYVELFDRGRSTSLNLYEHLHGDSRERGQAMVDLAQTYERAGLRLAARELPDYLPVLLEFLSTRPAKEAVAMLADCAHLVRAIGEALVRRGSPYAAVPGALLRLAHEPALADLPAPVPQSEPSIDEEWVDAPVLFGLGCGDARQGSAATQPLRFVPRQGGQR